MERFSLLQLSDFHFFEKEGAIGAIEFLRLIQAQGNTPAVQSVIQSQFHRRSWLCGHNADAAEAVVDFVFNNREDLDALVVTGDLATHGSTRNLEIAAAFLGVAPPSALAKSVVNSTLEGLNLPIGLIPGNHDRFGSHVTLEDLKNMIFTLPPGCREFDVVFNGFWKTASGAVREILKLTKNDTFNTPNTLLVLGADFCLAQHDGANDCGKLPFCAHFARGRVCHIAVGELLTQTGEFKHYNPCSAVVWAVHFEPKMGFDPHCLLDEDILAKALKHAAPTQRPDLILTGHTHSTCRTLELEGVPVLTCGTACQAALGQPPNEWCNVFLERYSSAVESKSRKDYQEFLRYWQEPKNEPDVFREARARICAPSYSIRESASHASMVYCGVFCLMALQKARDWRLCESIELQELQDHHIFPRAYLRKHGIDHRSTVNSVVNRTLICGKTNGMIKDQAPADYVGSDAIFPNGPKRKVLDPHFLSENALTEMRVAKDSLNDEEAKAIYEGFRDAREKAIISKTRQVCGIDSEGGEQ